MLAFFVTRFTIDNNTSILHIGALNIINETSKE